MRKQKTQLQRTVTVDQIIEQSGATLKRQFQSPDRLMVYFKKWPIEEVRLACLKAMAHGFRCMDYLDWARETVIDLVKVKDREMALEVMREYSDAVLLSAQDSIRGRMNFKEDAPDLLKGVYTFSGQTDNWTGYRDMVLLAALIGEQPEYRAPMLKIVCFAFNPDEFPNCYYNKELQPTQVCIASALDAVKGIYSEGDWHCAERVLRLLTKVKDKRYIDRLKTLIDLHKSREARPNFVSTFAHATNLAVLKETLRILQEQSK